MCLIFVGPEGHMVRVKSYVLTQTAAPSLALFTVSLKLWDGGQEVYVDPFVHMCAEIISHHPPQPSSTFCLVPVPLSSPAYPLFLLLLLEFQGCLNRVLPLLPQTTSNLLAHSERGMQAWWLNPGILDTSELWTMKGLLTARKKITQKSGLFSWKYMLWLYFNIIQLNIVEMPHSLHTLHTHS